MGGHAFVRGRRLLAAGLGLGLLALAPLRGAIAAAVGSTAGRVLSWGQANGTLPPSVDGTSGTAAAIDVGLGYSCAIQAGSGAVVCWHRCVPSAVVDTRART